MKLWQHVHGKPGYHLPNYMASHTRRQYFSQSASGEPLISILCFWTTVNLLPMAQGADTAGAIRQRSSFIHFPHYDFRSGDHSLCSGLWPNRLHGITNQNTVLFLKHVFSPRKHISHFEIPCKSAPRGIRFDYRPTVRLLWWFPWFSKFLQMDSRVAPEIRPQPPFDAISI